MANNKSAEKRIKIAKRNCLQNRFYKSSVKHSIKMFLKDIETSKISTSPENEENIKKSLNYVYSKIDKVVKRNVFHKNRAARKKARLVACMKLLIS